MQQLVSQKTHEIVGYIIAGIFIAFMIISNLS
jgi:hypothetical protein